MLSFELYLRRTGFLLAQPAPYPCIRGDSQLNHLFRANCKEKALASALHTAEDVIYEVNSEGLRMGPIQAHAQKLLVMGDSYTEGFGLNNDETISAQINQQLRGLGAKNWQVLNAGVVGFSPALYKSYYANKLQKFDAKKVLLNLDFTDLQDDVNFLSRADFTSDGELRGFPGREFFPAFITNIVFKNHSALLRFFHQELNLWSQDRTAEKNKKIIEKFISDKPFLIEQSWLDKNPETKNCWKNFELTARLVQQLKESIEKNGGSLAIHMYPPGYSMKKMKQRPSNISFYMKWKDFWRTDYSFLCSMSENGVAVFKQYANAQGIPFFSSMDFLKNHPQREHLYFEEDAHWNKAGVRAVAEFLTPKLWKDFLQLSAKQGKRSGQ